MSSKVLKTTIRDGQRYYDQPIMVRAKNDRLELGVRKAVGSLQIVGYSEPQSPVELPLPITMGDLATPPRPLTIGHERIRLRWMTPDGKGNLKDRE